MQLNFKSVLLRALLVLSARRVDAHSIEVLSCLMTTGDLRVFVRHWHGALGSAAEADEMVIDGAALPPDGIINDVATLVSPWPELFATGCSTPVVQEAVCTDQLFDYRDDFVYYDFPTVCDVPVSHVFEEGTTVYLEDGCKPPVHGPAPMYPVTISGTFACPPTASPVGRPTPPPVPPQTECLGCNFFSSVLGRPAGSAPQNSCNMEMADMVIKGQSGRCSLPSNIFQRECLEYPCYFEATFKIRISSRSCPGGCKLVVWDGSEQVIAVSIAPSSHGTWLSFSYKDRPKCECRTHRIKAAFSCPGRPPYVLTQRAEYTCSECERTPILG